MKKQEIMKNTAEQRLIPFTDDLMFALVMRDTEICREFLRLILPEEFGEIKIASPEDPLFGEYEDDKNTSANQSKKGNQLTSEPQKTMKFVPDMHGVRLDVYIKSDKAWAEIEMQTGNDPHLGKRSRFYQSNMDLDCLEEGRDYHELKKSYVIFFCTFDPFHQDEPIYFFQNWDYEKGLKLYTNGVLIADKNKDLLPDYFGFVKGIVDSEVDLNVSRETVQQSRQLKLIASNIEKKIKNELTSMLETDREKYEKFYKAFGLQLKFGLYESWGSKKDVLQDLLMFHSVKEDKLITFKEYVSKMSEDQKYIYYATGKSVDGIKLLPQCEKVLENGYDILCFTDDVDEFAIKFLTKYDEKEFRSVSSSDLGLKEEEIAYEDAKEITDFMKEALDGKVADVKISARLKSHPVCISAQGDVSVEMEKVLNANPNKQMDVKAEKVLEINANHPIYGKIKSLFETDKDKLKKLTKVLYA